MKGHHSGHGHGHAAHQGHGHGHQGHGHQGHVVVVTGHKGHAHKLARGGSLTDTSKGRMGKEPPADKPMEDERTKEMEEREMKGRKFGGKVMGGAPKMHLGRRARGGRMTPKSPLSGADVKHMPYETQLKATDEGGGSKKGGPRP